MRVTDIETLISAVALWTPDESKPDAILQPPDGRRAVDIWLNEDIVRQHASSAWIGDQEVRRMSFMWGVMVNDQVVEITNDVFHVRPFEILPHDTLQLGQVDVTSDVNAVSQQIGGGVNRMVDEEFSAEKALLMEYVELATGQLARRPIDGEPACAVEDLCKMPTLTFVLCIVSTTQGAF